MVVSKVASLGPRVFEGVEWLYGMLKLKPYKMSWKEIANSTDHQILIVIGAQHRQNRLRKEAYDKAHGKSDGKGTRGYEAPKVQPKVDPLDLLSEEELRSQLWASHVRMASMLKLNYNVPEHKVIIERMWQDGIERRRQRLSKSTVSE